MCGGHLLLALLLRVQGHSLHPNPAKVRFEEGDGSSVWISPLCSSFSLLPSSYLPSLFSVTFKRCYNKVPETEWPQPQKYFASRSWRLEAESEVWPGGEGSCSMPLLLLVATGHWVFSGLWMHCLCLCFIFTRPSPCVPVYVRDRFPLSKRTPVVFGEGSPLLQYDLILT